MKTLITILFIDLSILNLNVTNLIFKQMIKICIH
jgi:hypothetical protein